MEYPFSRLNYVIYNLILNILILVVVVYIPMKALIKLECGRSWIIVFITIHKLYIRVNINRVGKSVNGRLYLREKICKIILFNNRGGGYYDD